VGSSCTGNSGGLEVRREGPSLSATIVSLSGTLVAMHLSMALGPGFQRVVERWHSRAKGKGSGISRAKVATEIQPS
jgi:hypothetical protein